MTKNLMMGLAAFLVWSARLCKNSRDLYSNGRDYYFLPLEELIRAGSFLYSSRSFCFLLVREDSGSLQKLNMGIFFLLRSAS